MTLEEAIIHAEDTAISAIGCECREEHRQLAEWLKELAERRKQPEQKTGHWIEASVAGMPALYHEKCGAFVYAPNGKKGFNFCPNCGADMRGEQE